MVLECYFKASYSAGFGSFCHPPRWYDQGILIVIGPGTMAGPDGYRFAHRLIDEAWHPP